MREELTLVEVAGLLKVSVRTVRRWIAQGRLPSVKYSSRVRRVSAEDLEHFRARHYRPAAAAEAARRWAK